jgi:hypothetical protein
LYFTDYTSVCISLITLFCMEIKACWTVIGTRGGGGDGGDGGDGSGACEGSVSQWN